MSEYEQSWVESAQKLSEKQSAFVHLQSGNGNILSGHTNMPGTTHIHPDPVQLPSNHTQVPYQNYASPPIIVEENSKPHLRFYIGLLSLAIIQLVLAILSVIFGLAGFIVGLYNYYGYGFDFDFSGVWVGALYIVTCSCGIGSLRNPSGYRCLLVSYFVLLVISIVFTPVTIVWSSLWIYEAAANPWYYKCYNVTEDCNNLKPDLALNIVLLIVAGAESKNVAIDFLTHFYSISDKNCRLLQ